MRDVAVALASLLGHAVDPAPKQRVFGGSISVAWRWESAAGPLFVKLQPVSGLPVFEAEADGLRALAATRTVRVPRVRALGRTVTQAFLALEWLDLAPGDAAAAGALGAQLAGLHHASAGFFGWSQDNAIGATPQINTPTADWAGFFREHRLRFQLELARDNGGGSLYEPGLRLCELVPQLLRGHAPSPSLVHGDLWGGNWAMTGAGVPVLFDPAVYCADREVDIAMSQLFDGFGADFLPAYQSAWPLPPGAATRRTLYNLYHVLNHFNLFRGPYIGQAQRMIAELLAELR